MSDGRIVRGRGAKDLRGEGSDDEVERKVGYVTETSALNQNAKHLDGLFAPTLGDGPLKFVECCVVGAINVTGAECDR